MSFGITYCMLSLRRPRKKWSLPGHNWIRHRVHSNIAILSLFPSLVQKITACASSSTSSSVVSILPTVIVPCISMTLLLHVHTFRRVMGIELRCKHATQDTKCSLLGTWHVHCFIFAIFARMLRASNRISYVLRRAGSYPCMGVWFCCMKGSTWEGDSCDAAMTCVQQFGRCQQTSFLGQTHGSQRRHLS